MRFANDLGDPEGPVLLPDGSWMVVEMRLDRGCVSHISRDGRSKRVVAKTGRPNGLAVDRDGIVWVAESLEPGLIRLQQDGKFDRVLTECDGEPFLFPNDLAFGPDGALYMTDSGMRWKEWDSSRADYTRVRLDGRVYRIDTKSMAARKIDSGLPFANGIAFGPEKDLYVNATVSGMIYRYPWKDGKPGTREPFGNVVDRNLPQAFRGPDGMKFAANGDLYVAVVMQQDVTVLDAEGEVKRRIPMEGEKPTNLAFGPVGSGRIYVTERETGQLLTHDVGVDGYPLYM